MGPKSNQQTGYTKLQERRRDCGWEQQRSYNCLPAHSDLDDMNKGAIISYTDTAWRELPNYTVVISELIISGDSDKTFPCNLVESRDLATCQTEAQKNDKRSSKARLEANGLAL